MNKDVISITPEDDITDVIAQIKASEKKIVALVPPKPAGILRSAVNIKLIAKVAEESEKVPVIVTTDLALMKLASKIRIPIANDLKSRPFVPTPEDLANFSANNESVAEDFVSPVNSSKRIISDDEDEDDEDEDSEDEKSEEKLSKKSDKKRKKKVSKLAKKFPWIAGKEKIIIIAALILFIGIGVLIWAQNFNQSAEISFKVTVNNGNNFAESVTFTENESEENIKSGKFFLETKSNPFKQRENFTATGKKDVGDKASGALEVSLFFDIVDVEDDEDTITAKIQPGTKFYLGEYEYVSTKEQIFSIDLEEPECENGDSIKTIKKKGCQQTKLIPISASAPGEKYNVKEIKDEWKATLDLPVISMSISNPDEISGGTTKEVTIVLESDVNKVKEHLTLISDQDGERALFDSIPDSYYSIDSTSSAKEATFEISPAVGEEVKEGVTPVVVITREFSVQAIDVSKIQEYIKNEITLPEDQKIYSFGDPFVEYFSGSNGSYTGKLKTKYGTGPKITEEIVFDKVAGKKVGDAFSQLRSITGIDSDSIVINTSFLVNRIPDDKDRVKIEINFEE